MSIPLVFAIRVWGAEQEQQPKSAPELSQVGPWFNSEPLEIKKLRGQVVVLHFWTFGCINCQRNLPYYNGWQTDLAQANVTILGIHTPESNDEADPKRLAEQIKLRKIEYPVAMDAKAATWQAYGNRFWPTIYLLDKQGKIRFRWEGELEHNNAGGDTVLRGKIKELLAEK